MKTILPLIALLVSTNGLALDRVVYGEDDRSHLGQSKLRQFKVLAESTAAMIPAHYLETRYDGLLTLVKGETLQKAMNVCADEKFAKVMTAASCSGFLVAKNLLVTAGHCITNDFSCTSNKWVFDFRDDLLSENEDRLFINSDNVYSCKRIVSRALNTPGRNDFALIELDRDVTDRAPLKFRTEGKIKDDAALVVIGHPSGLPTIISEGANVRVNKSDFFFEANLDTFGGNSGSAVFNAKTKLVEGILVRGERDYYFDKEADCNRVFECKEDGCRGEDVIRITVIPELAPGMTPVDTKSDGTMGLMFDIDYLYGNFPFNVNASR